MKLFKFLAMMVFFSMFYSFSEQNQVDVLCSTDWFMVTVHPFLLNNDVYVHFYEVHLGLGCPPNQIHPHFYEFTYRVMECGIRVKAVSPDVVIYSSEIHYASKTSSSRYVIPVSCAAPRRSPWLTKPYSTKAGNNNNAATPKNEMSYHVFSLPEPSPQVNCSCPPSVFQQKSI
ncbi:placenta-specific protein 1-like [Microtus oregoni]|uniref:placenta-specific protein 1-like n=1 Tax=Microtus oregoni TaxID=111838 RepID=UPI001BB0F7FD|nr:placenta-specific protein 1-like [Microtus oregoni]